MRVGNIRSHFNFIYEISVLLRPLRGLIMLCRQTTAQLPGSGCQDMYFGGWWFKCAAEIYLGILGLSKFAKKVLGLTSYRWSLEGDFWTASLLDSSKH